MDKIEKNVFLSLLNGIFKENRLSSLLSAERCEKFYELTVYMLSENEKYNLTAIKEPEKIILNHYADCASISSCIKEGATLIDVGSGAGFPSLPLAIVRPDLKILAVDSTAKRVGYINSAARLLSLDNLSGEVMRAEDGARLSEYRESFDYATARAVAELRVLLELTLPFVKIGGELIAMKGKNARYELAEAKRAVSMLGGKSAALRDITLTGLGETLTHPLITVTKAAKTPSQYPRPYAQISKKPL